MHKRSFNLLLFLLIMLTGSLQAGFIIDDFEQNNSRINTLGNRYGDANYVTTNWTSNIASMAQTQCDITNARHSGDRGALVTYKCIGSDNVVLYSSISHDPGLKDLSGIYSNNRLTFWIKGVSGIPSINRIRFEGQYGGSQAWITNGSLGFKNYNNGSSNLSGVWTKISVPIIDFMSHATNTFSLHHVAALTLIMNPSANTNSFYIDEIAVEASPLPHPSQPRSVKAAGHGESICVTWECPVTDGSVKKYNVYRSSQLDEISFVKKASNLAGRTWTDGDIQAGSPQKYYYAVSSIDTNGVEGDLSIAASSGSVNFHSDVEVFGNYINTRSPQAKIFIDKPPTPDKKITVRVYDVRGTLIRDLANASYTSLSSSLPVIWDGKDKDGKRAGSGVYIVRVKSDEIDIMKKVFVVW